MFYDFCSIKNTIIDSEHNGTGTELSDVLESIEKQNFVNPQILLEHFWNVFVVDALLGNFDRHNDNWGFLVNRNTNECEIALYLIAEAVCCLKLMRILCKKF